jgi:RNA polymerase sigma-70 factor (ECF subfamily)
MTVSPDPGEITLMLTALGRGNRSVETELLAGIYGELKRLARRYMRRERDNHTLSSTALVHEAYLKLVGGDVAFHDRVHFFALAARAMRQILVDHGRNLRADKRGGGALRVELADLPIAAEDPGEDVIALDEALTRLAVFAPRQAQIVEMRFFGGMTREEIAEHLKLSVRTVHREWLLAKAWLYGELKTE